MESDVSGSEGEEEPSQILYDIVQYKEWEQEPEIIKHPDKQNSKRSSSYWPFSSAPGSPLPRHTELILGHRLPWEFAVSQDANLVAILQDNTVEIWHSKDSYGTLVGKRNLGAQRKDPAPSWRSVVWNDDAQLLAIAFSDGAVEVCDTVGGLIYPIISPKIPSSQPGFVNNANRKGPCDLSYLAVFFTNSRLRDKKWISELVLVDIGGRINSFLVSATGYQELSSFSVGWNLTSAVYSSTHNLLVTAGASPLVGRSSLVGRASHAGLVSYRLVNDEPHYVSTLDLEETTALTARSFNLPFISSPQEDHVIRLAVSENGRRLGAIHESGSISVWLLPGLLLGSHTKLSEQPGFDEVNPQLLQAPNRKKMKTEFMTNPYRFHPSDISWWNEESLIISRVSGALSVLRMEDLSNLLGDAPEFLDGVPRISQSFEKGFFALECESVVKGRRPSNLDDSMGEDPSSVVEVESDDEDATWANLGKRSASAVAFFLTDNERFAPPKKKSKLIRKTYRMIALVSTNPEELYARKIDAEEYGEAIMLAQHYRLDTDPVYERQWRQSSKSVAAIHDYLGKIKRRVSVIKECLETIPEDIDAVRELLVYGLSGTDLESLISMAHSDSGEFVHGGGGGGAADDWFDDGGGDPAVAAAQKAEKERAERLRLISKVNWQSLSLVQKDLIGSRLKFLYYLDVLDTYEEALGGGQFAADRFQPEVYRRMRLLSPLENCVYSARNSDPLTVAAFFTGVHSAVTLPHWLTILAAFPETTKPSYIQDIMPGLSMTGEALPWITGAGREPDWAEQPLAAKWSGHRVEYDSTVLYSESPELEKFRCSALTPPLIKEWYEWRARRVAQKTSIPELALDLLQQGLEHNVCIDMSLINNLRTLDALVYDVQLDIDLATFEGMDVMQQMASLLSNPGDLLHDIRSLLVPFLQRMEDANPGDFYKMLYNFCIYQAKTDLTIPLAVVENSGPKIQGPVVQNPRDTVRIGIDCCYAYETGGQTDLVDRISRCVADYFEFGPGRLRHDFIHNHRLNLDQFKSFIQHIEIGKILARHRVNRPLSLFKDSIGNHDAMQKIFESITCHAEAIKPRLDQDGWRSVLRDLQRLQKLIPVVPIQTIFYMFCESLISSGSADNIELAGDVLKTMMMEPEDQVALVVTGWTHYFSTSANLNDPNIELAQQCLGLVRSDSKEISECVDLISSLKSLTDFGLSDIHPVTVLNSKNRLEFVIKALDAKPHAYKNSQRLMKLATLLKAESIENLEGLVWTLVAKKALDVRDFNASHTACNNIIQCGYTEGWDVCFALGVQADFPDLQKCIDLLSFAVTHCDQENIENAILSLLKVEQKLLHAAISSKVDISRDSVFTDIDEKEEEEEGEEDEAEDKFEDTVEDLRARSPFPSIAISPFTSMVSSPYQSVANVKNSLLNVTRLSTQYLVDNEVSRTVLTHTSSWIKELASHKSLDTTIDVEDGGGNSFDCIRVPPFYGSLFSEQEGVKEGLLEPAFRKFSMPRIDGSLAAATQQALRSQLLSGVLLDVFSETEAETEERRISEDLLKELVPFVASQDVYQGIGLLLCLAESVGRRDLLLALPQTVSSLNFIITYLAILLRDQANGGADREQIFNNSPKNLLINSLKDGLDCDEHELLLEMLELAADHRQAGVLSTLAGDVDISRFSRDQEYKEDTILGLARFLEEENWRFTSTLAKRYHVDPWILAATHAEAIFVDNPDPETTRRMLSERNLVETLAAQPDRWEEWSRDKIFPLLDGTDHQMLVLFYETNHEVTKDNQFLQFKDSVEVLLGAGVGVDYVRLLSGDYSILDSVHAGNVEVLASAAEKVPYSQTSLTAPQIYLRFAENEFYRRGSASSNWVEALSNCQDILDHLDPHRFKLFVVSALLSPQSLEKIPRPARNRILKKSIKFVEIKIAAKSTGDWQSIELWIQFLKRHLDKFTSALSEGVVGSLDSDEIKVVERLELTGGEEKEIIDLFIEVICQEVHEDLIRKLIVIWRQDETGIEEGFQTIFRYCVDAINSETVAQTSRDLTLCIQRLLKEFEYAPDNLRSVLTPLCTLETLSVSDRLVFVQLLKQKTASTDEEVEEFDSSFLSELYQVQEAVQRILPDLAVAQRDLESLETKTDLFRRIIGQCSNSQSLGKLAEYSREFFAGEEKKVLKDCLVRILERVLVLEGDHDKVLELVLAVRDELDAEDLAGVVAQCEEDKKELYVKLIMKLALEDRYESVCEIVLGLGEVDDKTLIYLVESGLGAGLANSNLYSRMADAAMSEDLGSELVSQLKHGGHTALALALQLTSSGIPGALRTMAAFKNIMNQK